MLGKELPKIYKLEKNLIKKTSNCPEHTDIDEISAKIQNLDEKLSLLNEEIKKAEKTKQDTKMLKNALEMEALIRREQMKTTQKISSRNSKELASLRETVVKRRLFQSELKRLQNTIAKTNKSKKGHSAFSSKNMIKFFADIFSEEIKKKNN